MKLSRKWAAKVFVGFSAAMVVCTVLSRAAASALVAQVEVKGLRRGRLSYIYEGTGNIVPKKEQKIFLWEGQQVEWTAPKGSVVKKGKCLVRFRKKYLNQTIEKKQEELTQLELQAKEQQISARKPARVPAFESAYQTLSEAEKKLQKAKSREAKAKAAWEDCKEKEENAKGSQDVYDGGVSDKEGTSDQEGTPCEDGASAGSSYMKEKELKDAYLAAKSETEAARQEKAQAQAAYNLAKKEDAAQEKNSADAQAAAQTGVEATMEQVETARKALNILKGYKKANGKILAERDCTVLENSVQTGTITAGTEYISLGNGGWKLEGEIRRTDVGKIAEGAAVSVRFTSGGMAEMEIGSVEMAGAKVDAGDGTQKQTSCFWYAKMPEDAELKEEDAAQSGTFTWKMEVESEEEYEQVIPLSALREDVTGAYCLIITETEQMLGTLQTAKRVPVTVLEKDGINAAIISELRKEDQIIVSSEKFVAGGDRVRIKE